jgi:hypothetical protein
LLPLLPLLPLLKLPPLRRATGGKANRTRSSVETGKKGGPQKRAAKEGGKRRADVLK